jgi:hypothetical protein
MLLPTIVVDIRVFFEDQILGDDTFDATGLERSGG